MTTQRSTEKINYANGCWYCPYKVKCYICQNDLCERVQNKKCKVHTYYLDPGLRFKVCKQCSLEERDKPKGPPIDYN